MTKRHVAPELYLNRELGQLEFNRRVLALAERKNMPALERLRFLCIVDSNIDEFFEIRVAGLKEESPQVRQDLMSSLGEVFRAVRTRPRAGCAQYEVLNESVLRNWRRKAYASYVQQVERRA